MMHFADRLDRLPPYLFSELREKVSSLRSQGVDVITLGAGDPDMPPPDLIIEVAQRAMTDAANHRYPDNRGKPEFRKAAAEFMRDRFGVALDPENEIYPVLGGKEAIHHIAMICLTDGDVCLAPDPGYPVYRSAPVLAGADVYPLPLLSENDFLPDLDGVPAEIVERARLIYINFPNNPTGAIAGVDFFARVVAFAKQNDLIVVHDNSYSELSFDGYRPDSFLATPGARDIGVEVFSLSKGWNMTGWRVGWLAGNREIIGRYGHLKPNVDAGVFGAIQAAAVAAVTTEREFPKRMSKTYQRRRDQTVATLRDVGLDVRPQLATPFLWARVPKNQSSKQFCDMLLDRAGVVVSPGSAFGKAGEGFFRIALMVPDDRLHEAVTRICRVLESERSGDTTSVGTPKEFVETPHG